MAVLSRDEILARSVHGVTERVDLGNGDEIVVRGLTRGEATQTNKLDDEGEIECLALHFAIVEPAMSLDDIRAWRDNDVSGAVQVVANVVQRLSGSAPGQTKEATKSLPRRRRART